MLSVKSLFPEIFDNDEPFRRWPKARSALLTLGIHGLHCHERAGGWRRMASLRMPDRRDLLGGPATPAPSTPEPRAASREPRAERWEPSGKSRARRVSRAATASPAA